MNTDDQKLWLEAIAMLEFLIDKYEPSEFLSTDPDRLRVIGDRLEKKMNPSFNTGVDMVGDLKKIVGME